MSSLIIPVLWKIILQKSGKIQLKLCFSQFKHSSAFVSSCHVFFPLIFRNFKSMSVHVLMSRSILCQYYAITKAEQLKLVNRIDIFVSCFHFIIMIFSFSSQILFNNNNFVQTFLTIWSIMLVFNLTF